MKTNLFEGFSSYRGANSRTAVVIPAYKPPADMIELVSRINREGMSCIVVDDGCPVGYEWMWDVIEPMALVLHHDINRGKGAALKTAFTYIKNWCLDIEFIVTMDADGQHLVDDAARAVSEVKKQPEAIVLGVRDFSGNVPFAAKVENRIASVLFSGISKRNVSDTKTGLRAFSRPLLGQMIMIEGSRNDYEMNQLLALSSAGRKIVEIPMATIYKEKKRSTPFEIVKDTAGVTRVMLSYSTSYAISYAVELLLFMLLNLLAPLFSYPLILSGSVSRTMCAAFSWSLNSHKIAGKNGKSPLKKYIAEVAVTMIFGLLLMTGFYSLGVNVLLAKILADFITLTGYILVETSAAGVSSADIGEKAGEMAAR